MLAYLPMLKHTRDNGRSFHGLMGKYSRYRARNHCHGLMPHTDVSRTLEIALTLDVPFWPQRPNYSYYEDMYVQGAQHFPGIIIDDDIRHRLFEKPVPTLYFK